MQLPPLASPRVRSPRKSRERRAHQAPKRPVAASPALTRARCAGGPLDRALYHCHCGVDFDADVTASVSCPHCGDAQAW